MGSGVSDTAFEIAASVLVPGRAGGAALVLDDSLSFWGGFDCARGEIIDIHHPQHGQRVGGSILLIPASRGSAGTPGGIAETLRNGSGPHALVLAERDVNIGIGALVANRLYGMEVPVVAIRLDEMMRIRSGDRIEIDPRGTISVRR